MDYGAITLDTSIFDQHGLKLESGLLKTLEQFNGKPSPLILSEIIVREVISHLKKKAKKSRLLVEKAIRDSPAHLSLTSENVNIARFSLIPEISDKEIAENRMKAFCNSAGAIQIPVATVELDPRLVCPDLHRVATGGIAGTGGKAKSPGLLETESVDDEVVIVATRVVVAVAGQCSDVGPDRLGGGEIEC